jgi:protein-serine/threonine kinase
LISGVDYLHKKHIVHRDLKLENLLLDKHRNIIITDFGFANRFEHAADDLMQTSCGSPCYAAPELVVSEGLYVGSAVDIWSCGVILYAMLSGYLPYDDDPSNPDGDNISLLYKYIMNTRLNFPEQMSPSAKNLLQIMLVPNPELRCTISAIMDHPWLSQYTELFARSPADHEYIFQETMYHKSQQAKRELSERRRVQEEAKAYKAMQRSQSSAPGASVTASMLDHNRRKDQRHQSAMPTLSGTTTMPMHLNNGGTRTPPLSHTFTAPVDMQFTASAPSTTLIAPIPLPATSSDSDDHTTFPVPEPVLQPVATEDGGRPQKPVLVSQASETPPPSTGAVENESLASAPTTRPHTPPPRADVEKKEPMSANKNRHTIQVEYDVDASYERMQESLAERGSPEAHTGPLEASNMNLQPVTSDIEMDSGSENDHRTEESIMERISPDPSRVATPPPLVAPIPELAPVVPTTPTKASTATIPTSPTTPRATAPVDAEETVLTPRQKVPEHKTPRASVQPTASKRHESMPPTALFNEASLASGASGLPVPTAKRDRSRKGMSLDKLGLSRLLAQVRAHEDKPLPPSAFGQTGGLSKRNSGSRPSTSAGEVKTDKKSKRTTMQLASDRCVPFVMI